MKRIIIAAAAVVCCISLSAKNPIDPTATYLFAQRDTCELYLDVYEPAEGSVTKVDGKPKPTILFIFGGGFKEGERDGGLQKIWFRMIADRGYRIVAIDYRLGLKDAGNPGVNLQFTKLLKSAIDMAVEDLFSATRFIIDNSSEIGIDPGNIVICGSSAGAITALQAEWEICNGGELTKILPKNFNYKGVMSFSGAVFSTDGAIRYGRTPCPMLLMHGTDDSMVPYKQIKFLKLRFAGTDIITDVCASNGYNYNTWRFDGNGHEISIALARCIQEEERFLEENVMMGLKRNLDCTISDPAVEIPSWAKNDYKSLYK